MLSLSCLGYVYMANEYSGSYIHYNISFLSIFLSCYFHFYQFLIQLYSYLQYIIVNICLPFIIIFQLRVSILLHNGHLLIIFWV